MRKHFTTVCLLCCAPGPVAAQTGYLSLEGSFTDANDLFAFDFELNQPVGSSEVFYFQTFADTGTPANAAGDAIAPGGVDTRLELDTYFTNPPHGISDTADLASGSNDALLSWAGVAPDPAPGDVAINPDPFSGSQTLELSSPTGALGGWSLDLVAPASAIEFRQIVNRFDTSAPIMLDSFKAGTTGPGADPLRVNLFAPYLIIDGPMTVGVTGTADVSIDFGQVSGTTTVNAGSRLAGEIALLGDIFVHGGTLDIDTGGSSWDPAIQASSQFVADQNATVYTDSLAIGRDTSGGAPTATAIISSGATVTVGQFLDVGGEGTSGELTIQGVGTRIPAPFSFGGSSRLGADGGSATVIVRDQAELDLSEFFLTEMAADPGSSASLLVQGGASARFDWLVAGGESFTNAPPVSNQHVEITVEGAGSLLAVDEMSLGGNLPADPLDNSSATLTVRDGARLEITESSVIKQNASMTMGPGTTLALIGELAVDGGHLTFDRTVLETDPMHPGGLGVYNGGTFTWLTENSPTTEFGSVSGAGSLFEQISADGSGSGQVYPWGTRVTNGGEARFESFALPANEGRINDAGSVIRVTGTSLIDRIGFDIGIPFAQPAVYYVNGGALLDLSAASGPMRTLRMGDDGTNARLYVNTGSVVKTNHLILAEAHEFNTQAEIRITGAGSVLDQQGASTLSVGNGALYDAYIRVSDGGVFNTGTGDAVLNRSGVLVIQDGTLNARGHLIFNQGQFTKRIGGLAEPASTAQTLTINPGSRLVPIFVDGFVPSVGDLYPILQSATTITGLFTISDSRRIIGDGLYFEQIVTDTTIDLLVAQALPGDTDYDGDIDDSDLGTSFSNYTGPLAFGTGGKTFEQGDTDGDGDVDDSDLGTSFSNYTGPIAVNVPEPTGLMLLAVGGLVASRRRRSVRV